MKKKTILIPALAAVAVLASCGGTSSSSEVGSSETSSPAASSSPLGAPTAEQAVTALRSFSFDSLKGFTEVVRQYSYNFIDLSVTSNYQTTTEFTMHTDNVAGVATRENLSGVFTTSVINSFQGTYSAFDLTDRYYASAYDYGNDLSSYGIYETSAYSDKFDLVNNVDYYVDLISGTIEDPESNYVVSEWLPWEITTEITETEEGYEVKVQGSLPISTGYEEEDFVAVVLNKYDYSVVSMTYSLWTSNPTLTEDDEADTNSYSFVTLKDFVRGDREDVAATIIDSSTIPAENVTGTIPEVVSVQPGTLSEADVLEIFANQTAYISGTKKSTITGNEIVTDEDWNEYPATVEATMTAYQDGITSVSSDYTIIESGEKITMTYLAWGDENGITTRNSYGDYTYAPRDLTTIGLVDQLLSANALYYNSTALTLGNEAAQAGTFGTVVGDFGTTVRTLNSATCTEAGIITIDMTVVFSFESEYYSSTTYSNVVWTIDNGFLSGLSIKTGESAESLSYDLVCTMEKGELEEYPGIIIK